MVNCWEAIHLVKERQARLCAEGQTDNAECERARMSEGATRRVHAAPASTCLFSEGKASTSGEKERTLGDLVVALAFRVAQAATRPSTCARHWPAEHSSVWRMLHQPQCGSPLTCSSAGNNLGKAVPNCETNLEEALSCPREAGSAVSESDRVGLCEPHARRATRIDFQEKLAP